MIPSLEDTKNVIYCIQNKRNGKCYIGKTERTFFDRYPGGKWGEYTTNRFLKADYKRYGYDGFWIGIISVVHDPADLTVSETYYIGSYETIYPDGYNLVLDLSMLPEDKQPGVYYAGIVGKRCGMENPDELISKEELSKHIATKWTPEQRQRTKTALSKAHKGKTMSDEHKRIISDRFKGKKLSEEHKQKMRNGSSDARIVLQLDKTTEEVIGTYPSVTAAAKAIGKKHSGVSAAARGEYKHAYGFKWRYQDETT